MTVSSTRFYFLRQLTVSFHMTSMTSLTSECVTKSVVELWSRTKLNHSIEACEILIIFIECAKREIDRKRDELTVFAMSINSTAYMRERNFKLFVQRERVKTSRRDRAEWNAIGHMIRHAPTCRAVTAVQDQQFFRQSI
jgi:hypothetical protein